MNNIISSHYSQIIFSNFLQYNKESHKSKVAEKINIEIKVYSEENHLINVSKNIIFLYNHLKNNILSLSNQIQLEPRKKYIAFIHDDKEFIDIVIWKTSIDIFLNLKNGNLNDPKEIAKDVSNVGHWGNGDYSIKISNSSNFDYILLLIRQSFDTK